MAPDRATRLTIIAVVGSHDKNLPEEKRQLPYRVGRWIAENGYHLLTGGGPGVMEAACEGFCSFEPGGGTPRKGLAIGIIPAGKSPSEYPNRWVELPILTHLRGADPEGPGSRNHINIRSSAVVVAFTGGSGTLAEVKLALSRSVPVVACLRPRETIGGSDSQAIRSLGSTVVDSFDGVVAFLEKALRHC